VHKYSPLIAELGAAEEEAAYLEWLKKKVAESLADPRPPVPHEQVMAEIDEIIAKAKKRKTGC
jgi:ParB-like chromosome segregation protein Spo0J